MKQVKQAHGGNIYAYEAEHGTLPLDFSANINPLGMPEAARAAAVEALAQAVHYPDPDCTALREAIGRHEGVPAAQILCGNGASDLICRFAYAAQAATVLICAPSFGEYAQAAQAAGSQVKLHPLQAADGFRVMEAILPALAGVQAVFLCNPNNPTGLTIDPALLRAILDRCAQQHTAVLLDECFIDFVDEPEQHTQVAALAKYPNLVVLKAFTKFYGMPGLRLGYALCAEEALLSRMEAAGAPWSVSGIAQAAGIAALADRGYAAETHALIQGERAFMKQMLGQLGLEPMGEGNFLLLKAQPGLVEAMRAQGVLVRGCESFEGLGAQWVRIAIRSRGENMQLLSRLSGLGANSKIPHHKGIPTGDFHG